MPRKAKEQETLDVKETRTSKTKRIPATKSVEENEVKKRKTDSTKTVAKNTKTTEKEKAPKSTVTKTAKKTASSKSAVAKSTSKTKSTSVKTPVKATSAKVEKSSSTKKTTTQKSSSTKKGKETIEVLEYYDLPYRYNQTVVKILAQTPNTLFVYWDISDGDRNKFVAQFGDNFFNDTVPVLLIRNKTKNYSFEIEINDFANSWYFNVNDTSCEYEIELGRKSKTYEITFPNNYMHIVSSNIIETPNNHILFEKEQKTIYLRNVKTNNVYSKDVVTLEFMNRIGRIYKLSEIYKKVYKFTDSYKYNPSSSNNPTSNMF